MQFACISVRSRKNMRNSSAPYDSCQIQLPSSFETQAIVSEFIEGLQGMSTEEIYPCNTGPVVKRVPGEHSLLDNWVCVTNIITLEDIDKIRTEKSDNKTGSTMFCSLTLQENGSNTVIASRFWLASYILRLIDSQFSLFYFIGLKYILAYWNRPKWNSSF